MTCWSEIRNYLSTHDGNLTTCLQQIGSPFSQKVSTFNQQSEDMANTDEEDNSAGMCHCFGIVVDIDEIVHDSADQISP